VSPSPQSRPSVQNVPSGRGGDVHWPVAGLQMPFVRHGSVEAQLTRFPPTQAPNTHESVCVQALPSLHGLPTALTGFEQAPVPALQVPTA
jgi:hypothetical protein